MRNNILMITLTVFLVLPSMQLLAERKKGIGSLFKFGRGAKIFNGRKNYDENTLTVEKLKSCLLLEQRTDASEEVVVSEMGPLLKRQEQKLNDVESKMSSLKKYLDQNQNATFNTQQQVDEFNQKANRYNQYIPVYNKELDTYKNMSATYNKTIDNHNKLINKFKESCAGKRYYEDDLVTAKSAISN